MAVCSGIKSASRTTARRAPVWWRMRCYLCPTSHPTWFSKHGFKTHEKQPFLKRNHNKIKTMIIPSTKGKNIKTMKFREQRVKNINKMMIKHSRPNHSRILVQSIFGYNSSGDQKTVYTEALGTNNTYLATSRRFPPLEVHLSKKVPAPKENRYLDSLAKKPTFSYAKSSVFLKFHF